MQETKQEVSKDVPEEVRCSKFGCVNCLWASCECKLGSKYRPYYDTSEKKTACDSYTYYD